MRKNEHDGTMFFVKKDEGGWIFDSATLLYALA